MADEIRIRPIHPFPARMAPSIAWECLKSHSEQSLRVLDPMTGSGTTAVIARSLGHVAIGFDTDPLAVLIARTWCADIDKERALIKAKDVISRAKARYRKLTLGEAYPLHADDETRAFIRYWFDSTNRRQLAALSNTILRVRDSSLKSFLWCVFSRLIITKQSGASLAMDVSHSRPHRVYDKAPIKPFDYFLINAEVLLKNVLFKKGECTFPEVSINKADARQMPLESKSVDVVITSPPYLNAIDYLRGHKLSLVWMGYSLSEIRNIRSTNIGAEKITVYNDNDTYVKEALSEIGETERLSNRQKGMLVRYIHDMNASLSEVSRVLKIGGKAVFVVGDSSIRNAFISNSKAIISLGERHGLSVHSLQERDLPENRRYLPPPTSNGAGPQLQNRMRKEVIITFELSEVSTKSLAQQ